jgi:glutamate-1-semialdehyde 2,1-aminomutase
MALPSQLKLAESERLYARACQVIAGGTTQSKQPDTLIQGEYPLFAARGRGAYLWDVDGNEFLDWILGYGIIVLGYADPEVDEAAIREIREGFSFPLTKTIQIRLAELLVENIPCAERVHFFKAGSDSTTAAVRLARIWTKRNKIVRWGYNGWHDWCCTHDAGIPSYVRNDVLTFRYNDLNSLEEVLARNKEQVACVIMMPLLSELPQPGFLQGVKDLAHRHGALFILDEMRSGFHMALGGAQEYYGVTPDMATFSKAMSNGYTISALAGRREIMERMRESWFSSTFYTSSPEMAAAVATIERLKQGKVIEHMWRIGQGLMDGLNALAKAANVQAKAVGAPPMPDLMFDYEDEARVERAKHAFFTVTTRGGILLHPRHHWFITAAHTDADLKRTLTVCADGFSAVRKAM